MKDWQRSRVYAWDKRLDRAKWMNQRPKPLRWSSNLVDTAEQRELIRLACLSVGLLQAPELITDPKRAIKGSYAWANRNEIYIPEIYTCYVEVVLHEVAHSVIYHLPEAEEGFAGHGPEFARVFINLLARFTDFDRSQSIAAAQVCKVKVAPAEEWAPEKLLEKYDFMQYHQGIQELEEKGA